MMRRSFLFCFITSLVLCDKPQVDQGPVINLVAGAKNTSITCSSTNPLTWVKITSPQVTGLEVGGIQGFLEDLRNKSLRLKIDQYGHIEYDEIEEMGGYIQLARMAIEVITEELSGVYICAHEMTESNIKKSIRKGKMSKLTAIYLNVLVVSPSIEVKNASKILEKEKGLTTIQLDKFDSVEIECRGQRPIRWQAFNNQSYEITEYNENSTNRKYSSIMKLSNVTYSHVGYYICLFDNDGEKFTGEYFPSDHPNTTPVYVYVKDFDNLLFKGKRVPQPRIISAEVSRQLIVPCKPSFPEVNVTLISANNKEYLHDIETGFTVVRHAPFSNFMQCNGEYNDVVQSHNFMVTFYNTDLELPSMTAELFWQRIQFGITMDTFSVLEDTSFRFTCSVKDTKEQLFWKLEAPSSSNQDNRNTSSIENHAGRNIGVYNLRRISTDDSGIYGCYTSNSYETSTRHMFELRVIERDSSYVMLQPQKSNITLESMSEIDAVKWIVLLQSYPDLSLTLKFGDEILLEFTIMDGINLPEAFNKTNGKFEITVNWRDGIIRVKIDKPEITNVGKYTLTATAGSHSMDSTALFLFIPGEPSGLDFSITPNALLRTAGDKFVMKCSVYGNPPPLVTIKNDICKIEERCHGNYTNPLIYKPNEEIQKNVNASVYASSTIQIVGRALVQGNYICLAENKHGNITSKVLPLAITESVEAVNIGPVMVSVKNNNKKAIIKGETIFAVEGDKLMATCIGNNFLIKSTISWNITDSERKEIPVRKCDKHRTYLMCYDDSKTRYSDIVTIYMSTDMMYNNSLFICEDTKRDNSYRFHLHIIASASPMWSAEHQLMGGKIIKKTERGNLTLVCQADGVPKPSIHWFKDDAKFEVDEQSNQIRINEGNITFNYLFKQDSGVYVCQATNRVGSIEDSSTLEVTDTHDEELLIMIIAIISIFLFISIALLCIKVRKDRKRILKIRQIDQDFFEQGNPDSINPEMDLGEQADLLPYDKKFEFPRNRIILDNLLGSGAFGNVFKGTALNLISGESRTTVAVKMMKSQANDTHMKSLRTEVKIMIHIGRHINIVNLLGACSKDIATKGELLLIVEYCKHGNILEYMRRCKGEFVNQVNSYGKIDTRLRTSKHNRTSCIRTSMSGIYPNLGIQGMNGTVPNAVSNELYQGVSSNPNGNGSSHYPRARLYSNDCVRFTQYGENDSDPNEVTPDNYLSSDSFKKKENLCTKDLLHWAYQVANGMFYLSERKVIHGDLAARNILLASNNVVKISDFGLAKNIYRSEQYQKTNSAPVPVKWVALEALRDGIYSTQSDVWSFGIVIWEIFSLGQVPYPGIEYDQSFIKNLETGLRLSQPPFATLDIYNIMTTCWDEIPNQRPSFRNLENKLGELLGEAEREVYITLNAANAETTASEIIMSLKTPSYDTRMKGFFVEDEQGYQKPISSNEVEASANIVDDPQSMVTFRLGPVPNRTNARFTMSSISSEPHEVESLIEYRNKSTPYIHMSSPRVVADNVFTFEDSHLLESGCRQSNYLPMDSIKEDNKYGGEDREFSEDTYFQMNVNNSNKSSVLQKQPEPYLPTYANLRQEYQPANQTDIEKHDSGTYSPGIFTQTNPNYIYQQSPVDDVFIERDYSIECIRINQPFDMSASEQMRVRTQSEASSGVWSLSEDSTFKPKNHNKIGCIQEERIKS